MLDPNSNTAGNLETVLIVEPEILIRISISAYLRECGFRVIEAMNADEAIIVLSEPDMKIDTVLSDVEMPGTMDGFGLSQWMRANTPDIPIILAGSPARAAEASGDLCESGPMLAKPYEPQVLLDQIRRILAEGKRGANRPLKGEAEE